MATPILIGVIVIPAEFGKALYINNALEQGLREATRYLSRAPLNSSGNFFASDTTVAEQFIRSRLPMAEEKTAISIEAVVTVVPSNTSESLGTEFRRIEVRAAGEIDVPLLAAMNLFAGADEGAGKVVIASRDQSRYFGD